MSTATKALPADWTLILDAMQTRLDRAVAQADARFEALPSTHPTSLAVERLRDLDRWNERLTRLSAYLESAEQLVQSVDEVLQAEAKRLQSAKAAGESLRQKLAAESGGAIG